MLKVKVTFPYSSPYLRGQTPNCSCIWDNIEFFINTEISSCDYWIVLYGLGKKESTICPPENTIFVTGEPVSVRKYEKLFLEQFATVVTAQNLISHPQVYYDHQILPWYVHKTYDELCSMTSFDKKQSISLVTSNKRFSKGHEHRYKFSLALKEYFGNRLDMYGRGIRDFDDKWDVLAPYKYSIAIENFSSKYYVTEKLTECFLSYTFPFYYGCTNIDEYYPKESYEWIDITDIDGSISLIERVLQTPHHYSTHLDSLCEARSRYLEYYQMFPMLSKVVKSINNTSLNLPSTIILYPEKTTINDVMFKGKCFLSSSKNLIDKYTLYRTK